MSRCRKFISLGPSLFSFDSVTPTQTSKTSSKSEGGVVLWFRAAAAQRAREAQLQSQSHCSL